MDIEPESVENKFLARLRLLRRCIVKCHSNDSMDTKCHTKENYTIDEILAIAKKLEDMGINRKELTFS